MIGKISGRLDWRGLDYVLIDVRGVGYMVYCSDRVLAGMPGIGEAVALYTDLLVREDNLQLFGFPTLVEKEWHRLLMSVQGVGAKASLAIQGALGAEGISRALALGDWNALAKAKGIGPKTAQRVVMELKDKAPSVMAMGDSGAEVATADPIVVEALDAKPVSKPAPSGNAQEQADALSALSNLGYGPGDAAGAVAEAAGAEPGLSAEGLIRAALKLLAPKG